MVVAHSRKQLAVQHRITTGNVPDDLIFNFLFCQVIFPLFSLDGIDFIKQIGNLFAGSNKKITHL